jgi:iron(III) transport system ATP-binding protein
MVYITHDQAEAMALADRVAVMDRGRLLQVAAPDTLYHRPATPTVAGFVGTSTVVPVEIAGGDTEDSRWVRLLGTTACVRAAANAARQGQGRAMLRPADLELLDDPPQGRGEDNDRESCIPVTVARRIYAGGHVLMRLVHAASGLTFTLPVAETSALGEGARARLRLRGGWLIPYDDPV